MTDSSIPDVPAFADALSPIERAGLGLQDELSIWEIATATYPEKDAYPKRKRLTDFLLQEIKAERLAAYGNPNGWSVDICPRGTETRTPFPRCESHQGGNEPIYTFQLDERPDPWTYRRVRHLGDWSLIQRADYLALLETPAARGIPAPDWWKAPQGEPEPLPHGKPDKPGSGAAAKHEAVGRLLAEIDKRAVEQGAGFDRHSLPGTKEEFARLLKSHCPIFRHIGIARIAYYLKGHCQFQRGA